MKAPVYITSLVVMLFSSFDAVALEIPEDLPDWIRSPKAIEADYPLANVLGPLRDGDDPQSMQTDTPYVTQADVPFEEHVRRELDAGEIAEAEALLSRKSMETAGWLGSASGLFQKTGPGSFTRHEAYGVGGPLSTVITGLAEDSRGVLWVATPLGLSRLDQEGTWQHIQGREGLPVEALTTLHIADGDQLWLGTDKGAILYRPYGEGRQWFYRAGGRYLKDDAVSAIATGSGGWPVYLKTATGISCIDRVEHTLAEKAEVIEARLNRFHRRMGLVVESVLNDPLNPTHAYTLDDANDGLWTSWHVAAMSLAYGTTGRADHKASAQESMHAMIALQNATGISGSPARSIIPAEIGAKRREMRKDHPNIHKREEWRPAVQEGLYWRTDTSNDEIDGHFLAFYSYWRHIAQHDAAELALIQAQVRAMMDHILENGYELKDWDGETTHWGRWSPKDFNDDPTHFLENGLGSLQLLSFLKTTYAITGDAKYQQEYEKLIVEYGYLSNVQLEKKIFPDELNHSDDQLAYTAWYPLLQLEWDPEIRTVLRKAVRRHYRIIQPKRSSYFFFATATGDPGYVNLAPAVQNLRNIPTDRRLWQVTNSHRADVHFEPHKNRFDRPVIERVLPGDERHWYKWNRDPFVPDGGGPGAVSPSGVSPEDSDIAIPEHHEYIDGCYEDDGASWLLPYWMGRYHGYIAGP